MARKPKANAATIEEVSQPTTEPARRGRGRPPGGATMRRAEPQRNTPTPARRAEVLAEYTRLNTEGQRVNQSKSTLLKNFEKEGGDTKALKALHNSLKLDPSEAVSKLETLLQYHAGAGIQVKFLASGQGTVLEALGPEARKPAPRSNGEAQLAGARAHADGYNSGLHAAVPSDNPFSHAPGSEEYLEWHKGRDDGQADRDRRRPDEAARRDGALTADGTLPTDGLTAGNIPF